MELQEKNILTVKDFKKAVRKFKKFLNNPSKVQEMILPLHPNEFKHRLDNGEITKKGNKYYWCGLRVFEIKPLSLEEEK